MVMFADRVDAGRQLARELASLRGQDVVVLGLPRGGVEVAAVVAAALSAPLDVIVVRKVGVPSQPELAMGAIGEGGVRLLDEEMVEDAGVTPCEIAQLEARLRDELDARLWLLRHGRPSHDLSGRIALIVDDGMATGATARVACEVARRLGASRVVVAVPVAPPTTVQQLTEADAVVCVSIPQRFISVGRHYQDFGEVDEHQVVTLLDDAQHRVDAETGCHPTAAGYG